MKKQIKQLLYSLLYLAAIINLYACDDELFDVTGSTESLAYLNVNGYISSDGEPQNVIAFDAIQTPAGNFSNIKAKFPVKINKSTGNVTVTAAVDNSVVEAYNAQYKKSYLPLPEGLLSLEKSSVTVEQGKYLSTDSLALVMDNSKISELEPGKEYLTSVKLASVSGDAQLSKTHNNVYVKISVRYESVNKNAGSKAMIGTMIKDHSGWTYVSENTTSPIKNLWNENGESGLEFNANPSTIVFNMNSVKKITGICAKSIYGDYGSDFGFSNITLFVSKDNANWQEIANLTSKEMKAENGKQFICLYGPVEAQYIKLELTWSEYNWAKVMTDLGVYAK